MRFEQIMYHMYIETQFLPKLVCCQVRAFKKYEHEAEKNEPLKVNSTKISKSSGWKEQIHFEGELFLVCARTIITRNNSQTITLEG